MSEKTDTPSRARRTVRGVRRKARGAKRRLTEAAAPAKDVVRILRGKDKQLAPPPPYHYHHDREGKPIDPPEIVIRDISPEMGRGVFAARAFAEGETVEVAPIMLMIETWDDLPAECRVRVFNWGHVTGVAGEQYALPLGYGTFFNHTNDPNLRYVGSDVEQTLTYIARRDIEAGEQLYIHYDQPDGVHAEIEESWFAAVGIVEEVLD
ncbi:MAG: SET domain-containing protein-lysine N-methyltransferase [Actinomycetota bacterium]